jgi:hypothetical protein
VAPGDYGELATVTAVVVITLATLRALSVWGSTPKQDGTFKKKVMTVSKDGVQKTVEIEIDISSNQSPDAQVLKQLGAAFNIDISALK